MLKRDESKNSKFLDVITYIAHLILTNDKQTNKIDVQST